MSAIDVLPLGNLGNPKQKTFLKKVNDVFDNHRGNIPDDLALTKFRDQSNHTILFNTMSPELNGKQLILVNNNEDILLAPIDIQSILCSDKRNNTDVNLIIQKNNKNIWEARSDEGLIKLLIRFEEPKVSINGFSIQFADSTRTKYKLGFIMVNEENEIISQVGGMVSSFESNTHQFFQFTEIVEGVNRVIVDLELPAGTNIFEWKVKNISLYNYMNAGSLKALNDSGTVIHTMVPNPVLIRESKDGVEFQEEEQPLKTTDQSQTLTRKTISAPANTLLAAQTDSYGTPLPAKPDLTHQFFDNLDPKQLASISNVKRLHSVTDLQNGHKAYTFETNSMTRDLTLTFSPTEELNRGVDDPEVDLEKLVQKGYIKLGGFKNYCLTFYIKLDEITMQDQNLIWKYGGWLFNDTLPQYSRATDVYIPLGKGKPQIFAEYAVNRFIEMTQNIQSLPQEESFIPEGKWIGFRFTREVEGKDKCYIHIDINRNPFNEKGRPSDLTNWETILDFEDSHYEEHTANVWGGINEIISVTGAKYVSLYGISLYEVEW